MKSSNVFSLFCGVIVGVFMALLFNERARESIIARSAWLTKHPRNYGWVLAIEAVIILFAAYLISLRYS